MNQASFANMGGPRPPQQVFQQGGGMQRNGGDGATNIQAHILSRLQSQHVQPGWQQVVQLNRRAVTIQQMVTGLRILKPQMNLDTAIGVATEFEMQQFNIAPDLDSYNNTCRQKLTEIHNTRQTQASLQQQHLQNQQAGQMGMTPQQMQARAAMAGQNTFPPGMSMAQPPQPGQGPGIPLQQQPTPHQRMMHDNNPMHMQQNMRGGQPAQGVTRAGPPTRGQPQFSPEDNQQIMIIMRNMLARLTEQDRIQLQAKFMALPPQQQQAMHAQGIDHVQAFVRNQATQAFLSEKQKRLQANGQGLPPTSIPPAPNQGRPMSQVPGRGQQYSQPSSVTQQLEPTPGVTDLDQFLGQQQEGLRHQAAGQDVVPASNGQTGPHRLRETPHQPQGQFAPPRSIQPPNFPSHSQPQWNGMQAQQSHMQAGGHNVVQTPVPNFTNMPGPSPQQQHLHGQLGGLGNNRGQRTPQQGHDMPTLNQPMDPPAQTKNGATQRVTQPTAKQDQTNRSNGQMVASNNAKQNQSQQTQAMGLLPEQLAKLPPHIQQQLQQLPKEKHKAYIMHLQKLQQEQRMRAAAAEAQNPDNAHNPRQQAPAQATQSTQPNSANHTNGFQPNFSASSTAPQPVGNAFARGGNQMQNQGSQQGQTISNGLGASKMTPISLNPAQIRFMDNQPFPRHILNKSSSLAQISESIRTWGQLKEYIAHQGANILGPNGMAQLAGIQSIHMQQIMTTTANHQRMQQAQARAQNNAQQGQTGQAPQAPPMIPPHLNPSPVPGAAPPAPFPLPNLPQPTMQEVLTQRASLPEKMKNIPDNQLRVLMMRQRQQDFLKANQQKLNPQQQQLMQQQQQQMMQRNNLLRAQRMNQQQSQTPMVGNQASQVQPPPQSQNQAQQPVQQQAQPPQPSKQPAKASGKQPPPNRPGQAQQANQKRSKLATTEDVFEISDPRAQQASRVTDGRPGQPSQMAGASQKPSNEQMQSRMQEMQRAKSSANGQRASTEAASVPPNSAGDSSFNQNARPNAVLEALIAEVDQSLPHRPPVPMSPKTRGQMAEKLKDNTAQIVQKVQQSLPMFLRMDNNNREQAKELLQIRALLLRQVQDAGFNKPVDNFTMTLRDLEQNKQRLTQYLSFFLRSFQPHFGVQTQPSQPQQLSAANLQQQQAMFNAQRAAASAQKSQSNANSRAPAAPTATHPPFQIGSQSPQGVPLRYAASKNELTQEQLRLPPGKKRKPNQAASPASTSIQAMNTPVTKSSPAAKVESPEISRAPTMPTMWRCPVPDCENGKTSFATREELENHRLDIHENKEPAIKDPLDAAAYAIESLRICLNLDENGKSRPAAPAKEAKGATKEEAGSLRAPLMKATASTQSQAIKQEAATPMSRNPTQTGPSPSSNLLKTPQTTNVKTPTSDAKPATKDGSLKGTKAKAPPSSAEPDPWVTSHVRPEWFTEVFSGVRNLNSSLSPEFLTNWMERNAFSRPSSPSTGALDKDSPHKSDVSPNDKLNINVEVDDEDWVLSECFNANLRGDLGAFDVDDVDMVWDDVLKIEEPEEVLGKGKRRRDPMDPSDEWLKVWAPEKFEEDRMRDEQQQQQKTR